MRKALFYLLSWAFILLGLPFLAAVVILSRFDLAALGTRITDVYLALFARLMLGLTGSTVEVEGLDQIPQGPVLFISNHQGHFDSAVILAHIRKEKAFVASSNASKFPIFRTWFHYAHTIYLDKDNIRQNYKAMQKAEEVLDAGRSVVIYPEGVISAGPQLGPFKKGAFKPALIRGVPIVPLIIDGTWKIMGEHGQTIQPARILARILPPVRTEGLSRREQQALPDQISTSIRTGLEELRLAARLQVNYFPQARY